MLPADHPARRISEQLDRFDTSRAEARYSSLGRKAIHPRCLLKVWVYASTIGISEASVLARMSKTDQAIRFLSGGISMSDETLKRFRRNNTDLLAQAVQWTLEQAVALDLVDPRQLAVDSYRLPADASTKSVRTVTRSKERLEELSAIDRDALSQPEQEAHDAKVDKHETALQRCEEEGRTSHSITDPHAALMKLPNGAAAPAHRVTAVVAGKSLRFVVAVLVTSRPTDYGHLEEPVREARARLIEAGMPVREGAPPMQVAADAGYQAKEDLSFAAENRDWVDVLTPLPPPPVKHNEAGQAMFGRERFVVLEDGGATCPAGRAMAGPYRVGKNVSEWRGVDCGNCDLKSLCTKGKARSLVVDAESEELRGAMRKRMEEPGAKARYNERIATVEPVFSSIADVMGFRRAASRRTQTVASEVLLRVLAHNLDRLHRHGRGGKPFPLSALIVSAVSDRESDRILAVWAPIWRVAARSETSEASEASISPQGRSWSADSQHDADASETGPRSRVLFVAGV
jgi:transposase